MAPRPRSATWLARRFEVSTRTVERDLSALQQSGVPIYAEPGRTGGYAIDRSRSLPPVNFTAAEAVAMAVALHRLAGTPFHQAASTALRKLLAVMPEADAVAARRIAGRVRLIGAGPTTPIPALLADALLVGRVLRIGYADRGGATSTREIEPLGYIGSPTHWYLHAWCRLRAAPRAFRTDRIRTVTALAEPAPVRELRPGDIDIPADQLTQLHLG